MKEEWETCMSHKDRLPDPCAFVSASSWRSRAWQNWCTTSLPSTPAAPSCTWCAGAWLPARPRSQSSLWTRCAPASLPRVSQRWGLAFHVGIVIHSSGNISWVWWCRRFESTYSMWVKMKEQVLLRAVFALLPSYPPCCWHSFPNCVLLLLIPTGDPERRNCA